MNKQEWPKLDFDQLKDTLNTVHLWTQIVGKIRLRKTPWLNHSWHVTLYISANGLTTGSIPYPGGIFQIDFDFLKHELQIHCSNGGGRSIKLASGTVSAFYADVMDALKAVGVHAPIYASPNEMEEAVPFADDHADRVYDPAQMGLLWQAMIRIHNVMLRFRAGFTGKVSPVHFFWGAFDLAVTRFSGREAPKHPGGAPNMPADVMQEAYSHEVSSAGFWPGSAAFPHPAFYAYCYPTPGDFKSQKIAPASAFYSEEMGEFLLKYEDVQQSSDPEEALLSFLQTTYEAAANTGKWDRESLETDLTSFEKETGD
ncbi:MAG: hypothetical protein INR69_21440 [Mucilaginibacter polytrichastri]|nr:hypothetical protein [Mucilaginibacter polytrichastri]